MQNANSNSQPVHFPALYLEPSVSTTTVVTTTTTTTTYAPIPLPTIPSTSAPPPKDGKEYPLYNVRLPPSMREFNLVFPGGKRAFFREQSEANEGTSEGNFGTEELASGKSWRMMPREDSQLTASSSSHSQANAVPVVGLTEALEGYSTKKRDRGHEFEFESIAMEDTPARKKARAPPSPLPSPHGSPPPDSTSASGWHSGASSEPQTNQAQIVQAPVTPTTPFEADLSMTTLLALPSLLNHFTSLPESLQSHILLVLLRHSPLPVLRTLHSVLHPTLARDFLTLLPPELVSHILGFLTLQALGRACRVCKTWRGRIEGDKVLWRDSLIRKGLWFGGESEANFCKMLMKNRRRALVGENILPLPHPYKILFKSRYLTLTRWITNPSPKHISFPAHGHSVVTCLLFSQNRIISASDDHSIHVYSPITGDLLMSLDGHEGGVWALAAHGNLLVSGSTDRTVRIWDLREGKCLHVFGGHTSTVRCLAIVKPEWITHPQTGKREKWPKRTVVVTGSRDHTLRVWRLPKSGEREFDSRLPPLSPSIHHSGIPPSSPDMSDPPDPSLNPYHMHLLSGHSHAVRALAARGRTLVSGSYDCTVRVWDIPTGRQVHTLTGHTQKVYSVVLDSRDGTWGSEGWGYGNGSGAGMSTEYGYGSGTTGRDGRAASGSMDGTVRLWSITTGDCLHILSGHTSLVGLLGLSPSFLVSAAADSTLRVWDARLPSGRDGVTNSPSTGATPTSGSDLLKGVMAGHTGAITCFQHDEWKVVSGSDGTLKVWDLRDLCANAASASSSYQMQGVMGGGGAGWGLAGFGAAGGAAGGFVPPAVGPAPPVAGGGGGGPGTPGTGTVPVMRDLLTGITGVWQVAFEGRWCVSASNRNDVTVLDVWDFGSVQIPEKVGMGPFDPLTPLGSGLVEVGDGSEREEQDREREREREREMTEDRVWTWEDEEWVGEPSGGVYDYEDSDLEDSDVDDIEGSPSERDDDDIELISVHGGPDEDDEDIIYTGRWSAALRRQTSVPPSSTSTSTTSRTTHVSKPSRPAHSRSNRNSRAMSEVSRISERSIRSRGSNSHMEIDVDLEPDYLPQVPEESRSVHYEEPYGPSIDDREGDDKDAEMVEDMMEIDYVDPQRSSHTHTQRRQHTATRSKRPQQQLDEEGFAPASPMYGLEPSTSTSRNRNTSTGPPRRSSTGAQSAHASSSRRTASSTRASAGSYVGRRGQGPSTSSTRMTEGAEVEPTYTSGADGQGDDEEIMAHSPGINGSGSKYSKRRWL